MKIKALRKRGSTEDIILNWNCKLRTESKDGEKRKKKKNSKYERAAVTNPRHFIGLFF